MVVHIHDFKIYPRSAVMVYTVYMKKSAYIHQKSSILIAFQQWCLLMVWKSHLVLSYSFVTQDKPW